MLSSATSLTSMCQQLSQTVGVGTGATILYLLLAAHGAAALTAGDFSVALLVVGGVSMLSVPLFLRMSPDAGAEVMAAPSTVRLTRRHRKVRLLAWNIRQGGGTRLVAIAEALARHDADILVLSEYRGGESGLRLVEALARLGYRHATRPVPPPGFNGVLIAARTRFHAHGTICADLPEPYKLVSADFPGFRLCGAMSICPIWGSSRFRIGMRCSPLSASMRASPRWRSAISTPAALLSTMAAVRRDRLLHGPGFAEIGFA